MLLKPSLSPVLRGWQAKWPKYLTYTDKPLIISAPAQSYYDGLTRWPRGL